MLDFQMGSITPNEIRVKRGRKPLNQPGMDVAYLPAQMLPVGDDPGVIEFSVDNGENSDGNDAADWTLSIDAAIKAVEGLQRKQDGVVDPNQPDKPQEGETTVPKSSRLARRVHRMAQRDQRRYQKRFKSAIRKFFREQLAAVLKRWDQIGERVVEANERSVVAQEEEAEKAAKELTSKGLADILVTIGDANVLSFSLIRTYGDIMLDQHASAVEIFGIEDADFSEESPRFHSRRKALATKIERINAATQNALERVIRDGLEQGLSASQIARGTADGKFSGIQGTFKNFSANRSELIARTESARASQQGLTATYEDMGVTIVDVFGCEDAERVKGQKWGCNSRGIPIDKASSIEFHPNHKGTIVPRITSVGRVRRALKNLRTQELKTKRVLA